MSPARRSYFTLIGSLPHLPAPERADRLPINRQRLAQRFAMLDDAETRELELAAELLVWQRAASFDSEAEVVRHYGESLRRLTHPGLRSIVEYSMELRTVFAALRRKQRGGGPPAEGESWGVGPRAAWIERYWDKADFGLGAVHPWIAAAREHLAAGHAEELERLQIDLLWKYLSRIAAPDPFSFDAVIAYALKWHLLDQSLARDPEAATERFRQMVEEVSHELEQDVA
jgi:hypothetical protein